MARTRRVVGIAAVVLFGACGQPDEPAADGSADSAAVAAADSAAINACEVIGEAELEGILGIELDAARLTNDYAGDSQCRWDLPGDAQRGVSISIHEHGNLENYRRVPGSAPVSELGDAAVWNADYGQLAVLDGARVLSVGLLIEAPQRAHAERIARAALETFRAAEIDG